MQVGWWLHLARRRERHRTCEELRKPHRLQAVREHIVERRDFGAKEGDAGHAHREHRAVEVQPVALELQPGLHVRIEVVVVLDEAGAVHHQVARDALAVAVRQRHGLGHELVDGVLADLELALLDDNEEIYELIHIANCFPELREKHKNNK